MQLRTLRIAPFIITLLLAYSIWRHEEIWSESTLMFAVSREDMRFYRGDNHELLRYNEAIFASRAGDFTWAESLLSPLLNNLSLPRWSEVYELYGDIAYKLDRSRESIRFYYEKSLWVDPENLRVEKKLELLSGLPIASSGSTQSWSTSSGSTSTWELVEPVASEEQVKLEELEKLGQERGEYMDYNASPILERDALIQSSLDILEWGKEKRDW